MNLEKPISSLTRGSLLARNTVWNLAGQLLPMSVAVLTIPVLIRGLGAARFGVLSLAWVVIGYFSLFDLGIGRALTKLIADKLAAAETDSIPPLAWTSLFAMLLMGVLGGGMVWVLSPWLVHRALKIPEALQAETLRAFYLLACSIPLVTVTSGLRGILEALQQFRILNFIRIPMTMFSLAGPLLVLPFSANLVPIVAVLVLGRLAGTLAHVIACFRAIPALRHLLIDFSLMGSVLRIGGWMNVSNLMAPIMVYFDRFLIGALISVAALAYYAAPFDLVTRLSILPGAVSGVLFPAFALTSSQDPERTRLLFSRGVKYIFIAVFPIVLIAITLAPEGLRLWLGAPFATSSSSVLRWIAAGVFANSLSYVPFALIQAAGRPDFTAKLQGLELLPYILAIYLLATHYGITGVAVAWTARVTADAALLFLFAQKLLAHGRKSLFRLGGSVVAAALILGAAVVPHSLAIKAVFLFLALSVFGLASWRWALAPEERAFMLQKRAETPINTGELTDVY
jgi:O-antigen/teichoic acid export membrane protein